MRHCIVVLLTFQCLRSKDREPITKAQVTSHETGIQSVESGLSEMLQSNTRCGETLQLHCTGFELYGTLRTDVCMFGHGLALVIYGFGLIPRVARFIHFRKEDSFVVARGILKCHE